MKILVFYVDKQYFNMVILFLRLRVRRELIIRRDGRAVEGTGLENRRCESIRGFESHSLRQLNFSIDLRKYPRGRRGSPAKGVGCLKNAARVQIPPSAPHAASILCLRRVFSVIYKISSRPRATSSSSSAPSRKRKKRMANSSRSPESTLLR